jgi:SAM-dependent methyltransferase
MDQLELIERVKQMPFWYHKICLAEGVITPGRGFDHIWDLIRHVRQKLDYSSKIVLDLGAWDGMWTFEAEKLGANIVVAADCAYEPLYNFLFCREVLRSRAIPYYNINMYQLQDGLDVFLNDNRYLEEGPENFSGLVPESLSPPARKFDIIHHLGLLYHLRDPLLSLIQTRSVIKTGGKLLFETAYSRNNTVPMMLFNGPVQNTGRVYPDWSTWWAPNIECIKEMLYASLFRVIDDTIEVLDPHRTDDGVSRVCLIAEAIDSAAVDPHMWREINRRFRNSGPIFR